MQPLQVKSIRKLEQHLSLWSLFFDPNSQLWIQITGFQSVERWIKDSLPAKLRQFTISFLKKIFFKRLLWVVESHIINNLGTYLPSHDASPDVMWNFSSGFKLLLMPITDGTTIEGNARTIPEFQLRRLSANDDKNYNFRIFVVNFKLGTINKFANFQLKNFTWGKILRHELTWSGAFFSTQFEPHGKILFVLSFML